jgi:Na+/H+-dicarboxylate symporter
VAVLATLWGLALSLHVFDSRWRSQEHRTRASSARRSSKSDAVQTSSTSTSRRIPFHSLADNIVPAVVLYSRALGIALITVERKHVVLDLLQVCGEALARVARMIIRLTPYGLFAIAATAAGTMTMDQFGTVADLHRHLRARDVADRALGLARTDRGVDTDSDAHRVRRQPQRRAHGVRRRRSFHRLARSD